LYLERLAIQQKEEEIEVFEYDSRKVSNEQVEKESDELIYC
jgi:hypothetical protein